MRVTTFLTSVLFGLLLLDLLLDTSAQQRRRPGTRRRKPNRKPKPGDAPPAVNCYTCFADFEKIPLSVFNPAHYIFTNPCYNPSYNYTLADAEYLTRCSATTRYCMVDVTRMNDVLLSVDRRCGERNVCRKTCLARGYGLIKETCTFCCGGRVAEDDPEYDEELHANYTCPGEPH